MRRLRIILQRLFCKFTRIKLFNYPQIYTHFSTPQTAHESKPASLASRFARSAGRRPLDSSAAPIPSSLAIILSFYRDAAIANNITASFFVNLGVSNYWITLKSIHIFLRHEVRMNPGPRAWRVDLRGRQDADRSTPSRPSFPQRLW